MIGFNLPAMARRAGQRRGGLDTVANLDLWLDFQANLNKKTGATAAAALTITRASVGTYKNLDGTIQNFTSGQLRIGDRGLLIERASTNKALKSNDISSFPSWSLATNTGVTQNAAVAPDGSTTAAKVYESNTNSSGRNTRQTQTLTASAGYIASVFAKAGERSVFTLLALDNGSYSSAHFDLINGTCTQGGTSLGSGCGIESFGNGWYRCWIQVTATGTPSGSYFDFRLSDNVSNFTGITGTGDTYTGVVNSGMYFWGAQFEAGAALTSLIPTDSVQVTRAADIVNVTSVPFLLSSAGTLYARATVPYVIAATRMLLQADDGTANNRYYIRDGSSNFNAEVSTANVNQMSTSQGVIASQTRFKGAAAFTTNSGRVAKDGAVSAEDTSITMPSGINRLCVGSRTLTDQIADAYIEEIAYYGRALSSAELTAITTL